MPHVSGPHPYLTFIKKKNNNNTRMQEPQMFDLMYIAIAIKETIHSEVNC